MIRCLHCHAETSNGLALCERCRTGVLVYLEFIPVYFRNLSRWRPGRAGSRPVPSSREPQGVFPGVGDPVSRALDEIGAELSGWARCLADDRPGMARVIERLLSRDEEVAVPLLCAYFARRLSSLSTLEWVGEFVASAGHIEGRLRALTERVVPGWYAGGCRQCAASTYVVPGLTWVTCGTCGATTYARDHLDVILDETRGWVAGPMRMAEALVALVDTEMSVPRLHKRISKWGERGRIETLRREDAEGDPVGPKRYRFGEVLDLLTAEGATRIDGSVAAAS